MSKVLTGLLLVLVTFVAGCGKGDKFEKYDVKISGKIEDWRIVGQEAALLPFDGPVSEIPAAAERLYMALRQKGRYFGGPLLFLCGSEPDWNGAGRLQGQLVFPLAPGQGSPEYADRDDMTKAAVFSRIAGGRYASIVYQGPLAGLEAGFIEFRKFGSGDPKNVALVFEDNLKDVAKRHRIRIMRRTGE